MLESTVKYLDEKPVEARNVLKCARRGCHIEVEWDAMPQAADRLPHRLDDVVMIIHFKTGKKLLLCSAECGIVALNEGQHLPDKLLLANSEQAKAAVQGAEKARKLAVVE